MFKSSRFLTNFIFNRRRGPYLNSASLYSTISKSPELGADDDQLTHDRIKGYVKTEPVVVFMKGDKQQPMCGFSRNVKLILDFHQIPFKDYDVLGDSDLREGIKKFGDWPTIPQVYVKGDFVGGSDILLKMHDDGEITEFFEKYGIKSRFSEQNGSKIDEKDDEPTKSGV